MTIYYKKVSAIIGISVLCVLGLFWYVIAATTVNLGTVDSFVILGGSTITNTGTSVITGDLGLSPGVAVTGFPPGTLTGTQHVADALAASAQLDLATAYSALSQLPINTVPTELGSTVKIPGVYDSAAGTFGITGTLTLDAEGDSTAVFIFKTASTLITAASSNIVFVNGAQACNVFWQVGSSATLGANSNFKGNILAVASITLTTGAAVEGRLLAQSGAVTLDTNVVTKATCTVPPHSRGEKTSGSITVVKLIINDNGGVKVSKDFPLFLNGDLISSGHSFTKGAPGSYTVTETGDTSYTRTFTGGCDADGLINLVPGDNKICIVTNDDIATTTPPDVEDVPILIVPVVEEVISTTTPSIPVVTPPVVIPTPSKEETACCKG